MYSCILFTLQKDHTLWLFTLTISIQLNTNEHHHTSLQINCRTMDLRITWKKNLSCNRSNWKMPYVSLSSFKLPFIQNKKEVAELKQTVILKSYGVPLPSPNMERNREEATHSPNLSWTITATCLPTFVLPVKDKRSILSSLAIAVLHNGTQSTVFNKRHADRKAACMFHIHQLQPGRSLKPEPLWNIRWLS